MNSFLKYNWPSILWAAFILVLCLLPGHELPSVSLWQADKIVHVLVYVVLAVLLLWGWSKQQHYIGLYKNAGFKILILTFCYSFGVEILQELLTTDRHFDWYDALANALGGITGVCIYGLCAKPSFTAIGK